MPHRSTDLAGLALQQAMEAFPTGVVIINAEGDIRFVNKEVEQRLGYARGELLGRPVEVLVPDHLRDVHPQLRADFVAKPRTRPMGAGRELFARHKDGREIPVEIGLNPVETEDGLLIVASIVDVTERRAAEQALRASEEQLRQSQKMEAVGMLASGIAHDFNNVLGAIVGHAELALMSSEGALGIRSDLEAILRAAERGRQLVERILNYGRRKELSITAMPLDRVVREALVLLRASVPATIALRDDLSPNTPKVKADETQIHQVVMNLVTNAAHAMPQGGTLTVALAPFDVDEAITRQYPELRPGPHARLTIADTGTGMPPEVLRRVFEPFYTTKPAGQGTGLGLSVIQTIVHRLGGTIQISSAVGQGTTVEILLPGTVGARSARRRKEPVAETRKHILYVEDELSLAELAKRQLQALGYRVTVYTSSVEALDEFKAHPELFDALVTDNNMPRISGLSLAHAVKGIRGDIPVVMVSGLGESVDTKQVKAAGVDRLLAKPYRLPALAQALKSVL